MPTRNRGNRSPRTESLLDNPLALIEASRRSPPLPRSVPRRHLVSTSDSGGHLIQSRRAPTGGRQITLTGSFCRRRLLQRGQPRRPGRSRDRRLHRNGSGQAPCPGRTKARRPAHPGHAGQAETRGAAEPLQAQKASRRAGVRTDQTGKRVQTVPVTRHRQRKSRMGADLHRAQPRKARPGYLSGLSFIPPTHANEAIWTGS